MTNTITPSTSPVEKPAASAGSKTVGDRHRIICHCGAHKSATSLIQNYTKREKKYLAKNGIVFHRRGQTRDLLGWGTEVIQNGDALAKFLEEGSKAQGATESAFSNENIFGPPLAPKGKCLYPKHEPIVKALATALKDFDVRIVYYIRPQVAFLQSYYLQTVHQGKYHTFEQFMEQYSVDCLSWRPLIENLQKVFGKDNVIVGDFRTIKEGQTSFLTKFFDAAFENKVTVDDTYEAEHNISLSDRGLHMALRINPLLKPGETGLVRRFLQDNFNNKTGQRPTLLTDQLRSDLESRYGQEYEDLLKSSNSIV